MVEGRVLAHGEEESGPSVGKDFGKGENILSDERRMREVARSLLKRGINAPEVEWGGWLGQYQAAVKKHLVEIRDTESGQRRQKGRKAEPDR